MQQQQNIFLIGPMGAGKTTIGKYLAKTLGKKFIDSDQEIEKKSGVTIPVIFEYEGEPGFRSREKAMIDELTQLENIVLATGGGVILDRDNRTWLAERGQVVYLSCPIEVLLKRTCNDKNRPLLNSDNPKNRMEEIMQIRAPLYTEIADTIVDTDRKSIRAITSRIIRNLNHPSRKPL